MMPMGKVNARLRLPNAAAVQANRMLDAMEKPTGFNSISCNASPPTIHSTGINS